MTKFSKRLIDIGANLTDPMFRGFYNSSQKHADDFTHMINRARAAGVYKIIITGGTLKESKEAVEIAKQDSHLYSTVGCHPTRCNEFEKHEFGPSKYIDELTQVVVENPSKVVAIGEIGLDYDRLHFCSKEVQKKYFEQQLILSQVTKLPLFLHNRNSIEDFSEIMEKNKSLYAQSGGVVHSFDGDERALQKVLALGLHVGINGCSLKTAQNLEVVKIIPNDKILIETDCPYCEIRSTHASFEHIKTKFAKSKDASNPDLPVKNRNEPMSLIQVLEVLSSVRQQDIEELAEHIHNNTNGLFFKS